MSTKPSGANQYCGFKVGDNLYGISVIYVQEIIKPQIVTAIPMTGDFLRGLINLRGQIVTSISLRHLFGIEDNLSKEHINLIINSDDTLVSFVVDEVCDVIEINKDQIKSTPTSLDPSIKDYVEGVHQYDSQMLVLLNPEEIIKTGEINEREKLA